MLRSLVLTILCWLSISMAIAPERVVVCAKYRTNYGWSKGYKVEATITKGSQLNQVTSSFNYNVLSTYVMIFWDEDEASVIEMDFPILTVVGQSGEDQQGRQWEIAKTNICF